MADLTGKTIAFLVATEGIEQVELTEPWSAVEDAGGTPKLLSVESGKVQAFHHLDKGDTFAVDTVVADADPSTYDGLVLPGGVANPDALRMDEDAVSFVREFVTSDRPVAAICHAPWTLAEADVVAWQAHDVVAQPEDRPAQRGCRVGRRGGRRGRQAGHEPQAGRPAGLQRRHARGVRRLT